ncbi:MAG TPA: hypothetical protein VF407_23490 [Polyangiaceae bacterium]
MKDDFDPDAPPSEEELAEAEKLRLALEDPSRASGAADLARALAVAHSPREIDAATHDAIVAKALATKSREAAETGRVIRIAFGATAAAMAIAAGALLWVRGQALDIQNAESASLAAAAVPLVQARSTAPLFKEPFDATSTSARVDRIAIARADDYRENMYARWGVK